MEWVVVGSDDVILTSSDGVNWQPQSSGLDNKSLEAIAWNGQQWVAVGVKGIILTSLDGDKSAISIVRKR